MADTTNIELERINEFVTQLVRITQIDGAFVYGVDRNGNSVKIACSTLTDTSELDARVRAVEARSQTNSSDIATLRSSLSGKANTVHTHNIADVNGLQQALNAKATTAQTEELTEEIAATNNALNNKSDVGHTHNISDVVNLQTELNGKAAAIHTHVIANVDGLQTELDGKSDVGHTHTTAAIEGLTATLDGKSNVGHTHTTADIDGLDATLDGKSDVGHKHIIADVENLQEELDGKAAAVHTHTIANVNGLQTELDNINSLIASIGQQQGFPQVSDLDGFEAAVGTVAMYVGETTEHYIHGYVYEKTGTNTWKQKDAQPRTSILYNSDTENLTIGNISDLTPQNSDND